MVQGPPRQLVEAVAARVAAAVLRDFPAANAVAVRVTKPHVAMPGALHSLGARCAAAARELRLALRQLSHARALPAGVEIFRERSELADLPS